VLFAPQTEDFFDATVTVSSTIDSETFTQTFEVAGAGLSPSGFVTIDTPTDFTVSVGQSDTQSLTIDNTLAIPVNVDLAISGTGFTLLSSSSFVLFPDGEDGEQREMVIEFAPTTDTAPFNGTLTVTAEAGLFQEVTPVALKGYGVSPAINVAPTALDFGTITVGGTTAPLQVTIVNSGLDTLTLISKRIIGTDRSDFAITTDTCPGELATSTGCYLELTFTASAADTSTADLEIRSSDGTTPTVTVDLTGTGGAGDADIDVTPAAIDLGNLPTLDAFSLLTIQAITVENTGLTDPLLVTNVEPVGNDENLFLILDSVLGVPTFPESVAAGATTTFWVVPVKLGIGPKVTTVEVSSNDTDEAVVTVAVTMNLEVGVPTLDATDEGGSNIRLPNVFPPGDPAALFNINDAIIETSPVIAALGIPSDLFLYVEGPTDTQLYDLTGATWGAVTTVAASLQQNLGDYNSGVVGGLAAILADVGDYDFTWGFDIIQDDAVNNVPIFYVEDTASIEIAPVPFSLGNFGFDDIDATSGAPATLPILFFAVDPGASVDNVDVFIWARDASGDYWYVDGGVWNGPDADTTNRDANPFWPNLPMPVAPFGFAGGAVYAGGFDPTSIDGAHRIYVSVDTAADGAWDAPVSQDFFTINVAP
jgi:hypothetical protein